MHGIICNKSGDGINKKAHLHKEIISQDWRAPAGSSLKKNPTKNVDITQCSAIGRTIRLCRKILKETMQRPGVVGSHGTQKGSCSENIS